jgi:hypothetical protein
MWLTSLESASSTSSRAFFYAAFRNVRIRSCTLDIRYAFSRNDLQKPFGNTYFRRRSSQQNRTLNALHASAASSREHIAKRHRVPVAVVAWRICHDVPQRLSRRFPPVVAARARRRNARMTEARAAERRRALMTGLAWRARHHMFHRLAGSCPAVMTARAWRRHARMTEARAAKRRGALVT